MLARFRPRLSFANVVSLIALFVALGGTSVAAVSLTRGSVKTKHLAKNAVTSPKVKDGSLRARDFARGQLPRGEQGAQGAQGPQGQPGQNGEPGQTGPRGPSDAFAVPLNTTDRAQGTPDVETTVATLTLPAGGYAFAASAVIGTNPAICRIRNQGTEIARARVAGGQVGLTGVATNTGGPATFTCEGPGAGFTIDDTAFRAIRVESLTMQP